MQQSSDEANLTMAVTKNKNLPYNLYRPARYSHFSLSIVFYQFSFCESALLKNSIKTLQQSLVFTPGILEFQTTPGYAFNM